VVKTKHLISVAFGLSLILFLDVWVHSAAVMRLAGAAHLPKPAPLGHLFWDTEPYAVGINAFAHGQSPYTLTDPENPLPFAYPPIFAWAGAQLSKVFPSPWGWRIYIAIYMISVYLVELLFAWLLLRPLNRWQIAGLCGFLPLAAFMSTVFLSGNMHIVWYAAAMVAALPGVRRGSWIAFYIVVALAAASQPVFLLMLLLPIFCGRMRQWIASALTAAAGASFYLAEKIICPQLYHDFRETINVHLSYNPDFGQGIFGIIAGPLRRLGHPGLIVPGVLQLLFSGAIVLLLILLRPRVAWRDPRWLALLALAVVLINPRIMPYDSSVGLIPAIYFVLFALPLGSQWIVALSVSLVCAAGHHAVGFTPLLMVGFAIGAWRCWSGAWQGVPMLPSGAGRFAARWSGHATQEPSAATGYLEE
jgi:hypothetical protein